MDYGFVFWKLAYAFLTLVVISLLFEGLRYLYLRHKEQRKNMK